MGNQAMTLMLRLVLGAVFLAAGSAKLPRRQAFSGDIQQYRLLRGDLARRVALTLPWLELVAAASLLSGFLPRIGAGLVLLLLLGFVAAVASAMVRRINLECACFGLLYRERVGWETLARDAILACLAAEVVVSDHGRFGVLMVIRGLPRLPDVFALVSTIAASAASLVLALIAAKSPQLSRVVNLHASDTAAGSQDRP